MLSNIDGSFEALVAINSELDAALDVAGHVLPIPKPGQRFRLGCNRGRSRNHRSSRLHHL